MCSFLVGSSVLSTEVPSSWLIWYTSTKDIRMIESVRILKQCGVPIPTPLGCAIAGSMQ